MYSPTPILPIFYSLRLIASEVKLESIAGIGANRGRISKFGQKGASQILLLLFPLTRMLRLFAASRVTVA